MMSQIMMNKPSQLSLTIPSKSDVEQPLDKALNDWMSVTLHLASKFYK